MEKPAASGGGEAVDEKTKRVRELLSSYYGNAGSESPQAPSRGDEKPSTPVVRGTGLDSAVFDTDRYLQRFSI